MKFFVWNYTVLFLFFALSASAQLECLPLQGNAAQSHKGKGKIGYDGKLYIPTTKGLLTFDGLKTEVLTVGTKSQELAFNALRQLYFSKDSTVWITYHDGGYSMITKDTVQHFINVGGPSDYLCFDVMEYKEVLYMGTSNGMYPFKNGKFLEPISLKSLGIEQIDPAMRVHDLRNAFPSREDSKKLWLIGIGLVSYDIESHEIEYYRTPKRFLEDFGPQDQINHSYLYADLLETKDAIYLTSWGGGLFEINKENKIWKKHLLHPYMDKAKLNENIFFEMSQIDEDNILIGSFNELLKFNIKDKTINTYNLEGRDDLFTRHSVRLSKVSNYLVINDYRNVCIFQNTFELDDKNKTTPRLELSDVKIEGLSQNQNSHFFKEFQNKFKEFQRSITFEYELIDPFIFNERSYEYKLNGLNSNWIKQEDRESVNFSNLNGGRYTFQIRHLTSEGTYIYSDPFEFTIEKYYYENWWFWLSCVLSLLLISGTFIYIKWTQKKKEIAFLDKHNRELAQLEMSALRAQMNPHFLFNSLNSIKNFALTKGPKETAAYLTKFSHLIRLILQNSKNPMVNLKDELDALKLYIEIESLRFENKFKFKFNIDEGLLITSIQIPPLILQPYVENAIWHGLMHKKDGEGILLISVKDQGNTIQCMIEDNGIGRELAAQIKKDKIYGKQKSLGMDITSNRIELTNKIYNVNTEVRIIDLSDKNGMAIGTRVLIDIPKSEAAYR